MATKFELEQKIIDNSRQRRQNQNIDKLEFLVPVKVSDEFLESSSFSTSRNSWSKKSLYLIIGIVHFVAIYQVAVKFELNQVWHGISLGVFGLSGAWFLWKFFENRPILKIKPEGLTIYPRIFNKWKDIEYLYFHTKYDDEGSVTGIYLVVNLKTSSYHEIMISDLGWSVEKLGRTLYQCMRRYGK
ncbi:MAG: hypothetical protein KF803_11875 [Cyclobacteriaceae bacterium]|nr:hypothetical protein [Cyclobacteriaceae bacterium]